MSSFLYFTGAQIGEAKGRLTNFIIEPFVAHQPADEVYICIYCQRSCDVVLFHHEGGVDIGDVDAKVSWDRPGDDPVGVWPSLNVAFVNRIWPPEHCALLGSVIISSSV